jgi:hypothetical protein
LIPLCLFVSPAVRYLSAQIDSAYNPLIIAGELAAQPKPRKSGRPDRNGAEGRRVPTGAGVNTSRFYDSDGNGAKVAVKFAQLLYDHDDDLETPPAPVTSLTEVSFFVI